MTTPYQQVESAVVNLYRAGAFGPPTCSRPLGLHDYSTEFCNDEDVDHWNLGFPDFDDRLAYVYLIEGIRQMNGMNHNGALAALRLAVDDLVSRKGER